MNESFCKSDDVGKKGEDIVDRYFYSKGYTVYSTDDLNKDESHPIDKIYINKTNGRLILLDIKTKIVRTKYPDTGFPLRNYHEYLKLQKKNKLCVILMFIDYIEGVCYGGKLNHLNLNRIVEHNGVQLQYPMVDGASTNDTIIYFPRCAMNVYFKLTPNEIADIKESSTELENYRKPEDGAVK